jgi:DNA-binding HxlR family transcriptional regulator
MVEDIVGCKWSLSVLGLVSRGIARPGAMQRSLEGLSTKVLNERLRKLLRFGLIERQAFPEVPPRVEYRLTPRGRKFEALLAKVAELERELETKPAANLRRVSRRS